MKSIAKVTNIRLDREKREIIITCAAKGSIYVQEPRKEGGIEMGFPMLMSSAPLVDGVNYVLEHHYHAVNAMKGNKEFKSIVDENKRLKLLINRITNFENGEKIKLDGLTYQKAINESSFYTAIQKDLEKI